MWHLHPDVITIGKAVAGGLPTGAYGVTAELGQHLDAARNLATGGTLFGNPLSAAAAKAALTQVGRSVSQCSASAPCFTDCDSE
jgi:glutamate-1-semialdehyde 2,1-aminomutase